MQPQPAPALPPAFEIPHGLLALKPTALLRAYGKQPVSFWGLTAYLFFEYVRPQAIYTSLDILPWAYASLLIAVGSTALTELGKRRWTYLDTGMVLFTLVILASLVAAFDPKYGVDNLDIWVGWILAYFAISTALNTPTRILLALLPWFLWNLKMTLFAFRSWASIGFGFRDWGVSGAPGWFGNSGEFGIQMCVIFPISLYFALGMRKQVSRNVFLALLVLPFTAVTGAISSSSRGALVGIAAIGVWMYLRGRYRVRGIIPLTALVVVGYFFVPAEQKARLSSSGDDKSSQSRLLYWGRGIEFAKENPVLGIGYKSWMPYYQYVWGGRLEEGQSVQLSHNFAIEAAAELGFTGLAVLIFILLGTFWMNARTRSLCRKLGPRAFLMEQIASGFDGALIGFIVSGSFVTVLFYPYIWVNLGMTVGLHLTMARTVRATRRAAA